MIYFNSNELFDCLIDTYRNDEYADVEICTFGMYLGVTADGVDWNENYPSNVRKFVSMLKPNRHKILVGISEYFECKPHCEDCKNKYNNTIKRFKVTKNCLQLNMKFTKSFHWKYYRIGESAFIGGINLSQSGYIDSCVKITNQEDINILKRKFDIEWNKGTTNIDRYKIT